MIVRFRIVFCMGSNARCEQNAACRTMRAERCVKNEKAAVLSRIQFSVCCASAYAVPLLEAKRFDRSAFSNVSSFSLIAMPPA